MTRETDTLLRRQKQPTGLRRLIYGLIDEATLALSYLKASLKRDRKSWAIGVACIALVTAFAAILQAGIDAAPILFLKLAEGQAGEYDSLMTAQLSADATLPFVNYTAVDAALNQAAGSIVVGSAPRWALIADVHFKKQPALKTSAVILVIDSDKEFSIGLGRSWKRRRLGEEEAYVATSALLELAVAPNAGERIVADFRLAEILTSLNSGSDSSGGSTDVTGATGTDSSGAAGGGPSGNGTDVVASLLGTLLGDSSATTTVDGLTALQLGLAASGLGGAVDPNQLAVALPGLSLVRVNLAPIIQAALGSTLASLQNMQAEYNVLDGISDPGGKYPSLLGNVVVIEAAVFADWVSQQLLAVLAQTRAQLAPVLSLRTGTGGAAALASSLDATLSRLEAGAGNFTYDVMQQYAMSVQTMARDRLSWYLYESADVADKLVADWAGSLTSVLGDSAPVSVTTPLGDTLAGLRLLSLFLNQIIYIVVAVLAGLSVLVIYALVAGDLEAKAFELGMLRSLGMRKGTLGQLLAFTTAAFAVPGLVIGLSVASLLQTAIVYGMGWYATLTPDQFRGKGALPPSAWAVAISLGVIMPALAVTAPISKALSSSLRDALDLYHSSMNAVSVTITRLKGNWGISPSQTLIAILLSLGGLCTFIVLPQAFLSSNLSIFLGLLSAVLIAMLLGLMLVALTVQGQVEAGVLSVLTFAWTDKLRLPQSLALVLRDRRLHTLAAKHLAGHRQRNRQTAGMVAITVAFLIFASSLFTIQGESIITNVKMVLGGDVVALIPDWLLGRELPQEAMTEYLTRSQAASDIIQGYTFVSLPLNNIPYVRTTRLANLVGLPRSTTRLYGVQRNLLDVAFAQYAYVTEARGEGLEGLGGRGDRANEAGSGGRGRDAATEYAYSYPIRALYDGAGALRLPVEAESGLSGYPRPLLTGEFSSPLYICGEDVATAALRTGDAGVTTATGGSWDPTLGWRFNPESDQQWPPYIDTGADSAYAAFWAGLQVGTNGSTDIGDALASVHAAMGDASSSSSSYQVPAFFSYDYCMLACNDDLPWQAADETPPADLLAAACGANGSIAPVEDGLRFPFYGPWRSAKGSNYRSAPYLTTPCNDSSSASNPVRGFPRLCAAGSTFNRVAQERSVAASYVTYVDVLMSESLRGSAQLNTLTPLQIRATIRDPASGSSTVSVYMAKARAMARKIPGFFFSSYATLGGRAPVLMRMRDYARLLAEAKTTYKDLAGRTGPGSQQGSGTGAGSSGSGGGRPWPGAATWIPSSTAWLLTSVPTMPMTPGSNSSTTVTVLTSGGGNVSVVYGPGAGFAVDSDSATFLAVPPADAAAIAAAPPGSIASGAKLNASGAVALTLDLGRCALAEGLRLTSSILPGVTSSSVLVRLYALSDAAAGGYRLVATLTWNSSGTVDGSGTVTSEAPVAAYSARYWAIVAYPAASAPPTSPLVVPDVTLRLSEPPIGVCAAVDLSPDDALTSEEAPKQRLIVKLKPDASADDRQRVLNGLRSTLGAAGSAGSSIRVQDVAGLMDSASLALVGLDVFFDFVAAIALVLCFFAAWLSFTSTVAEGSTELAIMRALGLSAAQVTRVFVYEALAVVLAAFVTGTVVGMALSVSLSLQLGLFLELPFVLRFPVGVFVFMLIACTILAVLASALPARRLSKLQIASVLKGRTT